jgi:hypothetical protein
VGVCVLGVEVLDYVIEIDVEGVELDEGVITVGEWYVVGVCGGAGSAGVLQVMSVAASASSSFGSVASSSFLSSVGSVLVTSS